MGVTINKPYSPTGVGRVLYVSTAGNNSTAVIGRQDRSYSTIQGAVTASSNGDLIVVFNGTYAETVTINKNIQLELHKVTITAITLNFAGSGGNVTIVGDGNSTITTLSVVGNGESVTTDKVNITTYTHTSGSNGVTTIKNSVTTSINCISAGNTFNNLQLDNVTVSGNIRFVTGKIKNSDINTVDKTVDSTENMVFENTKIRGGITLSQGGGKTLKFIGCDVSVAGTFLTISSFPAVTNLFIFEGCNLDVTTFFNSSASTYTATHEFYYDNVKMSNYTRTLKVGDTETIAYEVNRATTTTVILSKFII